ncbi:metabotropic glutamate receptor 3 [Procambarus clarkii]|uniref:metabotropic glutamate receptor 3 n=1 Tax=Procambarus clarkii TaxID=6728 RepID=UPI001E671B97|nr:uncharacterized protein LOC123745931 [Procambarus clarkii]
MGRQILKWVWVWVLVVVGGRWTASECIAEEGRTVFLRTGDAVITQLLPLHHGPHCDQLGLTEVQVLEATKLAVHRVNQLNLVAGVKLGVRIVDTCGDPSLSARLALAAWTTDAYNCPQPVLTLGFLGPEDEASASAIGTITQSLGAPVMSYSPRTASATHTFNFITSAPHRSAQAAVHVLSGAGVDAISIVHTTDTEGQALLDHLIVASEYAYICVEMVLEDGDAVGLAEVLRGGPGTLVILGSRHRVQSLARALGGDQSPIDLLLLVDSGGPFPQVELAGMETPAIILQRTVPRIPELDSFFKRNLEVNDEPLRQYLATLSECKSCEEASFAYDTAAISAIAGVLAYAEALREVQVTHCSGETGLCQGIRALATSDWNDLLASKSLHTTALAAFPSLPHVNLEPGIEDEPCYTVILMANGTLTKVGQADESSAVLGRLVVPDLRCGAHCPCSILIPPLMLPPASNITQSSGFDVMGGAKWWNWEVPNLKKMSKRELIVYFAAFLMLNIIFFSSCVACLVSMNKSSRQQ